MPIVLWAWLFWHLRDEWSLNPQYNYGWIVPLAAIVIFYLRCRNRPPGSIPHHKFMARIAQWFCLILLLPIRVVEIANPDWRLVGWVLAAVAVAFSLLELYRNGGREWAKHFAFPIFFPLIAVPWPVEIENIVVQCLTRAVVASAVEIVGWLGIGALQIGNVIELHNGFVGVDEACSGVRTLQAGLMLSLLLGELFCLRTARRWLLLTAGLAWIFLCNVIRATSLVIVSANAGVAAMTRWHDLIGTALLIAGTGGIFFLAWISRGAMVGRDSVEPNAVATRGSTESRPTAATKTICDWKTCVVALAWISLIFVAAEFWYRAHEYDLVERTPWRARWPTEQSGFRETPISDVMRTILRYDDATSAEWNDSPGVRWWGFYAEWRPSRTALQLVRSHSPDICLPATGRIFQRELPGIATGDSGHELFFRSYEFREADRPLFVFVAIQDDKTMRGQLSSATTWNTTGRLLAAWRGERNLGQRLLELAILGVDDFASAREALLETVPVLIAD